MVERSALPVYGNVINWTQQVERKATASADSLDVFIFSEPEINWKVRFVESANAKTFHVERREDENYFEITQGTEKKKQQAVPFVTNGISSALELLKDTLHKE